MSGSGELRGVMTQFDPYYIWLGIPPHQQPPNHYRLLGLAPFESDVKAIAEAAQLQVERVRNSASRSEEAVARQILAQIVAAKSCLGQTESKAKYDRRLQQHMATANDPPVSAPSAVADSNRSIRESWAGDSEAILPSPQPADVPPPIRPPANATGGESQNTKFRLGLALALVGVLFVGVLLGGLLFGDGNEAREMVADNDPGPGSSAPEKDSPHAPSGRKDMPAENHSEASREKSIELSEDSVAAPEVGKEQDLRDALAVVVSLGGTSNSPAAISTHLNHLENCLEEAGTEVVGFALQEDFDGEELDESEWTKRNKARVKDGVAHLGDPGWICTKKQFMPGPEGLGVVRFSGVFTNRHPSFQMELLTGLSLAVPSRKTGFSVSADEEGELSVHGFVDDQREPLDTPRSWDEMVWPGRQIGFIVLDIGTDKYLCLYRVGEDSKRQWVRLPGENFNYWWPRGANRRGYDIRTKAVHSVGIQCSGRNVVIDSAQIRVLPWPDRELAVPPGRAARLADSDVIDAEVSLPNESPLGPRSEVMAYFRGLSLMQVHKPRPSYEIKDHLNSIEAIFPNDSDRIGVRVLQDDFVGQELDDSLWVADVIGDSSIDSKPPVQVVDGQLRLDGDILLRTKRPYALAGRQRGIVRVSGFVTLAASGSYLDVRSNAAEKDVRSGVGFGIRRHGLLAVSGPDSVNLPLAKGPLAKGLRRLGEERLRFVYLDFGKSRYLTVHAPDKKGDYEWIEYPGETPLKKSRNREHGSHYVAFRSAGGPVFLDNVQVRVLPRQKVGLAAEIGGLDIADAGLVKAVREVGQLDGRRVEPSDYNQVLSRLEEEFANGASQSVPASFEDDFSSEIVDQSRWQTSIPHVSNLRHTNKFMIRDGALVMPRNTVIRIDREFWLGGPAQGILRLSGDVILNQPASVLAVRTQATWNGDQGKGLHLNAEGASGLIGRGLVKLPLEGATPGSVRRFIYVDTGKKQYLTCYSPETPGEMKWTTNLNGAFARWKGVKRWITFEALGGDVSLDNVRVDLFPQKSGRPDSRVDPTQKTTSSHVASQESKPDNKVTREVLALHRVAWEHGKISDTLNRLEQAFHSNPSNSKLQLQEDDFAGQELDDKKWLGSTSFVDRVAVQDGALRMEGKEYLRTRGMFQPGSKGVGVVRICGVVSSRNKSRRGFQILHGKVFRDQFVGIGFRLTPREVLATYFGQTGAIEIPNEWRPLLRGRSRLGFVVMDTGKNKYLSIYDRNSKEKRRWVGIPARTASTRHWPSDETDDGIMERPEYIGIQSVGGQLAIEDLRIEAMPWPTGEWVEDDPRSAIIEVPIARQKKVMAGVVVKNSIGMKLIEIPAGEFQMGSDLNPEASPRHRVRISKSFLIGIHEVTQGQYKAVVGKNPSGYQQRPRGHNSNIGDTSDHPVENLSAIHAAAFCRELSRLPAERKAGRKYRLPTEAEWEYVCRAGTTTKFHTGDDVSSLSGFANLREYEASSPEHKENSWKDEFSDTAPVGSFSPNAFGVFDMHGNVSEYCSDVVHFKNYQIASPLDPGGKVSELTESLFRHRIRKKYFSDSLNRGDQIIRGGCYLTFATKCGSAVRDSKSAAIKRDSTTGFRVVLELE